MIHTFLDPLVECHVKSFLKLIISFLVQPLHHLSSLLIVTSSQVRVGTPLPLQPCCISGLGPEGLLHGHPVLIMRQDNAGENKKLEQQLHSADWKLQVKMEYRAADTPQQNALVELKIYYLAAKARAAMNAA
jgi:hypothetical protein